MRAWLLLLAGCAAPVDEVVDTDATDTVVHSDTPSTEDTAPPVPRPAFSQPAEAVDDHAADDVFEVTLTAAAASYEVGGRTVQGYAYNGQVPGPTLRAKVGDTLVVHLVNQLDTPTTIHWHGAGAPNPMDGVPWMRDPTAPGGTFTYTFELTQSGTFWYHPHFDTAQQVDLGLYGVLVVSDPAEPAFDDDVVVVFDSWGEADEDPHSHGLEGNGLVWTANGAVDPVWSMAPTGPVRWRFLNASNTGYLALRTTDMVILAHDQGVQTTPWQDDLLVLGPGDRGEVMMPRGGVPDLVSAPFSLHGGAAVGDDRRLLSLEHGSFIPGDAMPSFGVAARLPTPDPGTTDVTYTLQGDSGTGQWRINHEAFPDVTIAEVEVGDDVIVEVRNLSPTNHPFHGHGHAYEVLSVNGVVPDRYTVEDTIDVPVHGVVRLRFSATHPGDWMQHCHILPHADGGMMTVLRVLDPAD